MLPKQAKFVLKCSKMRWQLGLRPRPRCGSLRRSHNPLIVMENPSNHKFLATPLINSILSILSVYIVCNLIHNIYYGPYMSLLFNKNLDFRTENSSLKPFLGTLPHIQ